jgi:ribonuclease D
VNEAATTGQAATSHDRDAAKAGSASDSEVEKPGDDAPAPLPLLEPRDGTPPPIDTPQGLAEVAELLSQGTGPVAVDAERASGYRYGQRAYLVQLRRAGSGTALIDPLPFDDLGAVDTAIADAEWVLHAASQDLPCLDELGLRPRRLFDTELAGRLAGFERVGLGAMVERVLGYTLEKGHSAADWSTRPLPASWLTYAALDVELLVDLRDALAEELRGQEKLAWAYEEFAALAASRPPAPRAEPWRRTSGIHRVRSARGLARVRALWEARDELARRRDLAPGRVLPDSAIVAAAQADPADERSLLALPVFSGRATRRLAGTWLAALQRARDTADEDLPSTSSGGDGPPPAHRWADRDPAAAARLARGRQEVMAIAAEHTLPTENLLAPDSVRRLAWSPPDPLDLDSVVATLRSFGARAWQINLTAGPLTEALSEA